MYGAEPLGDEAFERGALLREPWDRKHGPRS
jgi:hypothetical protein